jgi:putative Mn2+ efflux pump MntP
MENLLTTVVLAFSMSADAFAAALGKGAALDRPRLSEALRTGFVLVGRPRRKQLYYPAFPG